MIAAILGLVFSLLGTYVLGAIRAGLALAGAIGVLMVGAWVYLGVPVGFAGVVLFATAAALFVLSGGIE